MLLPAAAPRDHLEPEDVRGLLGGHLTTSIGVEALNADLSVDADLSDALGAGSVKHTMGATIHGTCTLALDVQLPWGSTLLRPYALITGRPAPGAPEADIRCDLGVYVTTTPTTRVDTYGRLPYAISGLDRLYLLDRYLPDTRVIAAGTPYLQAVVDTITAAGLPASTLRLDTTAAAKTLPTARVFPLLPASGSGAATTWLSLVNQLLAAIGYRGLWADDAGFFRSGPYVNPEDRAPEWTFDADAQLTQRIAALGQDAERTRDDYALSNLWTFYQRNPAPGQAPLTYTKEDPIGRARRGGLIWAAQPQGLDAADLDSLKAQGNAIAAAELRVADEVTHTTSPLPLLGHADVYAVTDPRLGIIGRVASREWTQAWDDDGVLADVPHTWQLLTAA